MSAPVQPSRRGRLGRLADLIGPAAFAIVYLAGRDFLAATWAMVGGSVVALAVRFALERRIAALPLFLAVTALATALLSIIFKNDAVLKTQPTVEHALVGAALIVAWLLGGQPAKALLGEAFALTEQAWATLCLRFGLFALAMAVANEMIVLTQTDVVWALFHFPGQLVLHLAFLATQLPLILAAHRQASASADVAAR